MPKIPVAKKGGSVLTWANDLVRWGMSFRKFAGAGIRFTETPEGTWINVESSHSWLHPFKVSVSETSASVRRGFVNGEIPFIGDIRLDGTDAEYMVTDEDSPKINLEEIGVKSGRTKIVLHVELDGNDKINFSDPELFKITHEEIDSKATERVGKFQLAQIYWSDGYPVKVDQIVYHNLQHIYLKPELVDGEIAEKGEHFFGAA